MGALPDELTRQAIESIRQYWGRESGLSDYAAMQTLMMLRDEKAAGIMKPELLAWLPAAVQVWLDREEARGA